MGCASSVAAGADYAVPEEPGPGPEPEPEHAHSVAVMLAHIAIAMTHAASHVHSPVSRSNGAWRGEAEPHHTHGDSELLSLPFLPRPALPCAERSRRFRSSMGPL